MPLSAQTRKEIEELVEAKLRERVATKEEFKALTEVVHRLAQAQAELAQAQVRTEERLNLLATRVDELAQAQARTEKRVEELAQAQARTEERLNLLAARVDELAQAQARTEERLNLLAARVDELAQAQARTEAALQLLVSRVDSLETTIGRLGARWGIYSEQAFRNAMKRVLNERYGVTVEERELEGRQVDLLVRDGKPLIVQITSSTTRDDILKLLKAREAYKRETGEDADMMLVTAYISVRLMDEARALGIQIESHE